MASKPVRVDLGDMEFIISNTVARVVEELAAKRADDKPAYSGPAGGSKRIEHYTTSQLTEAISRAREVYGADFFVLLNGIDAFLERRKRRNIAEHGTVDPTGIHRIDFQ